MRMERTHPDDPSKGLQTIVNLAADYSGHMMRTSGSVPPTVIAETADGYVFCMPTEMTDDAAKDRFADVARLFAIAHGARSLVMIAEAWATLPDSRGHLDTQTPPSQSPNRREIVALMAEDQVSGATSLLPILRDHAGGFVGFGDPGPLKVGQAAGRFSGLMPRHEPSASDVAQAKAILLQLGLEITNRGFDPTMN
jgi:hypothetical protein